MKVMKMKKNRELKIGDPVIIKKPKNVKEHPVWIPRMDMWNGQIATIRNIWDFAKPIGGNRKGLYLNDLDDKDINWSFNKKWVRKISKEKYVLAKITHKIL